MPEPPAIAIIDDDAFVRASTSRLVRSLGYTAYTFSSAAEFLESGRLNDASCIISDVRMPGMSGIELHAHLVSHGHRVPFVFITAFPEQAGLERAVEAGAIGLLTKPFDGASLIACLDTALGRDGGTST